MSSEPVVLSREELDRLLIKAAEEGANRVLKGLGLEDADANMDVRELRAILKSWRDVRKTALQAVVKFLTTAILGAVLLGLGIKLGASNLLK